MSNIVNEIMPDGRPSGSNVEELFKQTEDDYHGQINDLNAQINDLNAQMLSQKTDLDEQQNSTLICMEQTMSNKKETQNEIHDLKSQMSSLLDEIRELRASVTSLERTQNLLNRINTSERSLNRQPSQIFQGINTDTSVRNQLEHDFYSMMMLSSPISKAWIVGFAAFVIQVILGFLVILDQVNDESFGTELDIPIKATLPIRIAQFLVIILSIMTQTDLLMGLRTIFILPRNDRNYWANLIDMRDDKSNKVWYWRIFVPNLLKMFQGSLILTATFITIVQSGSTVDLLKDYSALFVISTIDDLFFMLADNGYFGVKLSLKINRVKKKIIDEGHSKTKHFLFWVLSLIAVSMLSGWVYVTTGQVNGRYLGQKYPLCPLEQQILWDGRNNTYLSLTGDGICQFRRGKGTNVVNCGWDGNDCLSLNERYPDCNVSMPSKLGDGYCNHGEEMFNSMYCGYDNGDCVEFNKEKYPGCIVDYPGRLGDGECHSRPYNTKECNFDYGDCIFNNSYPGCIVANLSLIGNGICDSEYNTPLCSFDGNDCFNATFPGCFVENISLIGNGACDFGDYDTEECKFDNGDCSLPPCNATDPKYIGDGVCDLEYNTAPCNYDGGDCDLYNSFPDCVLEDPYYLGDDTCDDMEGEGFNTMECGFDAGDCVEFNEWYSIWIINHTDCVVNHPHYLSDDYCDNFGLYNTPACDFDAGDCDWFNENFTDCNVDDPEFLGDGECDGGEYNTPECDFDWGDCS